MSLVDLFSPSFLMYLGIMVLVIAVLVVYFESKSREQNHKIASMFSIVSTLAEDMNQMKFAVGHIANQGFSGPTLEETTRPFTMQAGGQLIEVSDDEYDDEDDDSVNDDESDSDSESDSVSDSESDSDDEEPAEVKVLKISNEQEFDEQEADELDDSSSSSDENVFDAELVEEEPTLESEVVESVSGMKTISIDLEDNESEESVDYKKLSLQKLKSVVVEKGLVVDASKLKKPELLKLLGIE
jgi:hypothetical protein